MCLEGNERVWSSAYRHGDRCSLIIWLSEALFCGSGGDVRITQASPAQFREYRGTCETISSQVRHAAQRRIQDSVCMHTAEHTRRHTAHSQSRTHARTHMQAHINAPSVLHLHT